MKMQKSFCRQAITLACLVVLCMESDLVAQGSFQGGGASKYSNGSVRQSSPASSRAVPPASGVEVSTFNSKPNSPFVQRTASRPVTQQDAFGNTSSYQSSGTDRGQFSACTVEYVDEIDVPALETGDIVEMNLKEGDAVPSGAVIAKINDTILMHQLRQALIRKTNADNIANDNVSIEAAEKQIQLNKHLYETARTLLKKGAVPFREKQTAQYEYEVSLLQKRAARVRQLEAQGEAELEYARASEVEERIDRHKVVSKFDGVVVERYKQLGEWVTAGEPVAKIARMDKLYVTGLISNLEYNPSEIDNRDVIVTVELARGEKMEFRGKIAIIGTRDIPGAGNEYEVKAEINNQMKQGQWVLRKRTRVTMKLAE